MNLSSNAKDVSLIPVSGTKISHAESQLSPSLGAPAKKKIIIIIILKNNTKSVSFLIAPSLLKQREQRSKRVKNLLSIVYLYELESYHLYLARAAIHGVAKSQTKLSE